MSNSSVQMPCRSGSPQGVFSAAPADADGVWADGVCAAVFVTDTEVMVTEATAMAAAEMATVTIEPEKRSPMTISLCQFIP